MSTEAGLISVDTAISKIKHELGLERNPSIINLLNAIIEHAYILRASDVHIVPEKNDVRVRFRIDGALRDAHRISKSLQAEIISRVKILTGLRTDEHQTAQDGRCHLVIAENHSLDIRVSVIPTHYGENAILRLLSDNGAHFTLSSLGFNTENYQNIESAIQRPSGMILVTGPTGSGKTTTLYALLKRMSTPEVSIITIEDPIEYAIDGIEQVQINPRTGLTFATGLKSILRQDPNIIMVGEIRDTETAGMAVNTALTGHLLLSTLHTNDAATTLPRLLDMHVESYLAASTISAIIGQRLARKVCESCRTMRDITPAQRESLRQVVLSDAFLETNRISYGRGCQSCNHSGYLGRVGIHEVLVPDMAIREAILQKSPASEIKKIAVAEGMKTMIEDGFAKVLDGATTIEEVLRLCYE